MAEYCQLWLSCKDEAEAGKIANTLLVKQLIACARQVSVKSDYRWQGKIENADEVLLMMESRLDLFGKIEEEVAKLHSYDTFNLSAVPAKKMSKKAEGWMAGELSNND